MTATHTRTFWWDADGKPCDEEHGVRGRTFTLDARNVVLSWVDFARTRDAAGADVPAPLPESGQSHSAWRTGPTRTGKQLSLAFHLHT